MWLKVLFLAVFATANFALYAPESGVIELKASNFENLVKESDDVWLVEFYAPWCGHCQNFAPEYEKAAKALKGSVKVGAVNGVEHKRLMADYNIDSFPSVKIFGRDKNNPDDFTGERTAQSLVDAALSVVTIRSHFRLTGEGDVVDEIIFLDGDNFDTLVMKSYDRWLIAFHLRWCRDITKMAPHWLKASVKLKGKAKLGVIDGTRYKNISSKFHISTFPAIKYFPPGKKSLDTVVDYSGGLLEDEIFEWVMEKSQEDALPPKIYQIIDLDSLKEACHQKPLCVVSVLPHILDCQAKCRNDYLDTLRNVSEHYKKNYWGYIWSEAGAQPGIEKTLEMGGYGYPAMAAVNINKMMYSVLKGSFSVTGITEFLRDVLYGRSYTIPLTENKLPDIITIKQWNGEDRLSEDISTADVKDEL